MLHSRRNGILRGLPTSSNFKIARILVALDFGDRASKVLEAALCIARSFQSELFLVHAVSPRSPKGHLEEGASFLEGCVQAGMKRLSDAVAARPSLNAFTHHEIAAAESPLDLIQRLVRSERIDLVVVGSHGAAGLERLAIGSFAEGLMRRGNCPTLIVGPHAAVAGDPFHKVLLATDLGIGCDAATSFATDLAVHSHGELNMLHVIDRKPNPILGRASTSDELMSRHRMRMSVPSDITSICTLRLIAEHGRPQDVIVKAALDCDAGVIVTGVSEGMLHDEHSPWSKFADVVKSAPCPVLAVRQNATMAQLPTETSALFTHTGNL